MASTIKIKNSSTASAVPTSSDLVQGELAVNVTDKRIFTENSGGTVVELGTNPSTLTVTAGATIQGLTVGKGAGSVATNTAVGASALAANTTGSGQTVYGYQAGNALTTASNNTAVGHQALYASTGTENTAYGTQAGKSITTGNYNCLVGSYAGLNLTTGVGNTFVGANSVSYNCGGLMTTGSKNTILGNFSGNNGGLDIRTASNYIVLSDGDGNPQAYYHPTNVAWYLPSAYTTTTASAANAFIGSGGYIVRSTSALKYKQDIRDFEEMDISLLRPVRYKSKCANDDQTKDHLGLIADEAAEAGFEELVTRGAEGEIEGFQYERLTVVLLKKLQTLDAEFKAYVAAHP